MDLLGVPGIPTKGCLKSSMVISDTLCCSKPSSSSTLSQSQDDDIDMFSNDGEVMEYLSSNLLDEDMTGFSPVLAQYLEKTERLEEENSSVVTALPMVDTEESSAVVLVWTESHGKFGFSIFSEKRAVFKGKLLSFPDATL